MPTFTNAPADLVRAAEALLADARAILTPRLDLTRPLFLTIAPDVLLAIEPHRNADSPERRFCGWLASPDAPLARRNDDHHCGPWHTATPGALLALSLDAHLQLLLAAEALAEA